jgi:tetratricopeptide (TPR) repeat protein
VLLAVAALARAAHARTLIWRDSETLYRDVLRQYPDSVEAHNNLGVLFKRRGMLDEAIREYKKTLALKPDHAEAMNNLAVIHLGRGALKTAEALLLRSTQLFGSTNAYFNLGTCYARQRRMEEAIAAFRTAARIDPRFGAAYVELGRLYAGQGRFDEAVDMLRTALEHEPLDRDPAIYRSQIHVLLGAQYASRAMDDQATQEFEVAIAIHPGNADAYSNLAAVASRRGDLEQAEALSKQAIALDPDLATAHFNLGLVYARQEHLDESIAAYRKAIELNPRFVAAYSDLGTGSPSPDDAGGPWCHAGMR